MKKQLIAVGLAGLLAIPAISFGAEMDGPNLYGSFRAGVSFGDGDANVQNYISRWGIRGSSEVSEGLTAAYRYETGLDTANAGLSGGRLSYVSLSGGFGTITAGQIWSAGYNHYGAKLDPTWFNGRGGGVNFRIGNTLSYSSSAGDVSFQVDAVTGEDEHFEFGATAALGPIGVGVGHWNNGNDDTAFTGVAVSAGAGGVGLAVGLGSRDNATGADTDTSIISVSGDIGDSGISYGLQITSSNNDDIDQNLVSLVNTLGPGVAIHFEHADPGVGDATSHLALRVDF